MGGPASLEAHGCMEGRVDLEENLRSVRKKEVGVFAERVRQRWTSEYKQFVKTNQL